MFSALHHFFIKNINCLIEQKQVKAMEKLFIIIGGDSRLYFLNKQLLSKNFKTEHIFYGDFSAKEASLSKIPKADIIILPVPLTKDKVSLFAPNISYKVLLEEIALKINKNAVVFGGGICPVFSNGFNYRNILNDEVMTLKNAMATAEAALSIIINQNNKTIFGSNILILGYGRIGKILSNYLYALHGKVTVCARKENIRAEAQLSGYETTDFNNLKKALSKSDIIVNTVPYPVIAKNELQAINKEAVIIDLASAPGGIDFVTAKNMNIKAIQALSLPGKYSPESSAEYIEESVLNTLRKEQIL